jgi:twinkle protein
MANIIADEIDFRIYMRETDTQTKVKKASDYIESIKLRLRTKQENKFPKMPWFKTHDNFEFRKGEVTLWSGQNGHGKSLMTSQIALSLIGQGEKVCIASFEMKPATTLQRMARMWVGLNPFSPEFQEERGISMLDDLYDQFGGWTDDHLWLYDQVDTAEAEVVIGMVRYCAKELGITHVFIDNLAKCVKGEDDYNGQKSFVDNLTAIAKDYNIHIHLVHHLKKPANENAVPDKHDNKGSGAITDLVDNVMLVWRNKVKEDDVKAHGSFGQHLAEPDHYLLCRKQRNYEGSGEGEPTVKLWFHRDAQQYISEPGESPMWFPNWPHVATPTYK